MKLHSVQVAVNMQVMKMTQTYDFEATCSDNSHLSLHVCPVMCPHNIHALCPRSMSSTLYGTCSVKCPHNIYGLRYMSSDVPPQHPCCTSCVQLCAPTPAILSIMFVQWCCPTPVTLHINTSEDSNHTPWQPSDWNDRWILEFSRAEPLIIIQRKMALAQMLWEMLTVMASIHRG